MTATTKIEFGTLRTNRANPIWPDEDGEIFLEGSGYRDAVATSEATAAAIQEDLLEHLPSGHKLYRRETISHVSNPVEVVKPLAAPTQFGAIVRALYNGVPVLATRADDDEIPWRLHPADHDLAGLCWVSASDLTVTEIVSEGVAR
jgi:hypothetical protein